MRSSTKPQATAILAVYNGAITLGACLDSLIEQSVPLEIIAIDDGSTDQTLKILKSYKEVKVLTQNHQGPALARNLGAGHAHTDILLFVDADMQFDPEYVKDLIAPLEKGGVIGTYTTNEQVGNWGNVWARCWNWQEGWEDKKRFPANPPKWGTDFRSIKKSAFLQVGGFDNTGYTDTWSLFHKLAVRPLATQALCYHKNPDTLVAVYRQARWSAKRPYKLGVAGMLYALVRTSFLISLITGVRTALVRGEWRFLVFKLVYDWGRFVGILEMIGLGKLAK